VSSQISADVGTYRLTLHSQFQPAISYSVPSSFILTVIHYCMRVAIVPSTVVDYTYYVSDSALFIPYPNFQAAIAECAPKTCSAKLQTGASLPTFMKATEAGILVGTPNPKDENTYPVQVTAIPPFGFDPSTSTTKVNFNIIVKCEPRKIAPGVQDTTFSFTIGSY